MESYVHANLPKEYKPLLEVGPLKDIEYIRLLGQRRNTRGRKALLGVIKRYLREKGWYSGE